MPRFSPIAAVALLATFAVSESYGIIIADPSSGRNTTAPTGGLAGSGWDLQGNYGSFLGTPIAPDWFITAKHVGSASALVTQDSVSHPVVETYNIAGTDLKLHRVSVPFSSWATLYDPAVDGALQTTDPLVMFGRGTNRGTEITGDGWYWGSANSGLSWGTNTPDALVNTPNGPMLVMDFDSSPNSEGTYSSGDSGGAVFVLRNGEWRLVGINYGVELFYTAPSKDSALNAAIYDGRDYYRYLGDIDNSGTDTPADYQLISGASPVPQLLYASYITAHLAEIRTVIPEPTSLGLLAVGGVYALRRRRRA